MELVVEENLEPVAERTKKPGFWKHTDIETPFGIMSFSEYIFAEKYEVCQ
jgi:hypothetical protein